MKSSESGMCIDSMEQPVGSDTQLFECHGQEGNQVIFYINDWLKAYIINLCKTTRYYNTQSLVGWGVCKQSSCFDAKILLCIC